MANIQKEEEEEGKKTQKIKCIITGKATSFSNKSYEKKLKNFDNEEHLHATYICKQAQSLVSRGYTVKEIRDILPTTKDVIDIPLEVQSILGIKIPTTAISTKEKYSPQLIDFLNNLKSYHG